MQLWRVHQFHPHTFHFVGHRTRGNPMVCNWVFFKKSKILYPPPPAKVFGGVQLNAGHRLFKRFVGRADDCHHGSAPLLHQVAHRHFRVRPVGRRHRRTDAGGQPELGMAWPAGEGDSHSLFRRLLFILSQNWIYNQNPFSQILLKFPKFRAILSYCWNITPKWHKQLIVIFHWNGLRSSSFCSPVLHIFEHKHWRKKNF